VGVGRRRRQGAEEGGGVSTAVVGGKDKHLAYLLSWGARDGGRERMRG
jgi:hypothetical protein